MDKHQAIFFEEARELLAELESAALALEQSPDDHDLVGRIFRAIHTLKGSSAMFGLESVAEFAHDLETAFDSVREGRMRVTPELVTLTLWSRDHMGELLECLSRGAKPEASLLEAGEEILGDVRRLMGETPSAAAGGDGDGAGMPETPASVNEAGRSLGEASRVLYRVRFVPPRNIYLTGSKPEALLEELAELGLWCEIVLHEDARLEAGQERHPDYCYSAWDVLVETAGGEEALRDVFIFVEDESELRIECLGDARGLDSKTKQALVDALRRSEDLPCGKLAGIIASHTLQELGEASTVEASEEEHDGIPAPQRPSDSPHAASDAPQQHQKAAAASMAASSQTIKVPSERLDKLVDLVGELVIVQARLSQAAGVSADSGFTAIAEEVESLVWELRDTAMSMRMLAIGTTFAKFARLVRDLSTELGKEIRLVTEGEETELDKTVIERLGDPLVHMIRNSIDHGIEPPDERERAGKARTGTIRLQAAHKGAFVYITIADDGRGLDAEAIRTKAVALGLLETEEKKSDSELFELIFAPGFSTAREVTSVSGRGVGMDVVRRSIEELGGRVEIESRKGEGTTITLKLPLTLAIVEGLLIEAGGESYILPLSIVKECVELPKEEERKGYGGDLINVRGEIVPFVRLREYYGHAADALPVHEYVVIVEWDGTQLGIAVDSVLGQHQTVIRSLGTLYKNVPGVSGATILGDGRVALIIDVPAIASEVRKESSTSFAYQAAGSV